jgi:hypothetical protein
MSFSLCFPPVSASIPAGCFVCPVIALSHCLTPFLSYGQQGGAFQLDESASYLFDGLARIAADNYMPTNADILRCRTRTTGVDEAIFVFEVCVPHPVVCFSF